MRVRAQLWGVVACVALATSFACASVPPPGPAVHTPQPNDPVQVSDRYAALVVAANRAANAGDFAKALDLANEALRERPFGIEAGVAKVEAHLGLGQRTPALDYAERLRDRNPGRGEASYACGKAYYALGRLGAAQDAFADGIALMPKDRLLQLAQLTALTHDPAVALSELEARAAELMDGSADDADVLHALAMANELRGDNVAADGLYVKAIAARPRHPFAHYNLALLRQSQTGMAAARAHFLAFLDQAPPSAVREVEAVRKLLKETPND